MAKTIFWRLKILRFTPTYLYLPNKTKSEIWVLLNKQHRLSLLNIINARLLSDEMGKQMDFHVRRP